MLLTTRDRGLAVGSSVELDVLSPRDARDAAIAFAEGTPRKAENEALVRVVEGQLGRLAVAVEVAGRAVKGWARSWEAYERLLEREMEKALGWEMDKSEHYKPGVFGALDLSIGLCADAALGLLEGAAVFAPDAVPLEWAFGAAGLDGGSAEGQHALGEIAGRGLVKVAREAGAMSMHRLVHKRVRARAEEERWRAASERAVELVAVWIHEAVGPAKEQIERGRCAPGACPASARGGEVDGEHASVVRHRRSARHSFPVPR